MSVYCGNLFGGGQGYADKCGVSRGYMGDGELDQCHSCQKKENESLRKDAGRYRWLRAGGQEPHEEMDGEQLIAGYYVTYSDGYDTYMNGLSGEELDAAIDALNRSPENH